MANVIHDLEQIGRLANIRNVTPHSDPFPAGYVESQPGNELRTDAAPPVVGTLLPRLLEPVETLWTYHHADQPRRFLILPDGRADLILRFRIEHDHVTGPVTPLLVGPSSVAHTVPVEAGDAFIGARLRPGRLGWLHRANALRDRRLAGVEAMSRVPSFQQAVHSVHRAHVLKAHFTEMLVSLPTANSNADLDAALDLIHLTGGRLDIGELGGTLGIGARRLHRLFVVHVGLPPSTYRAVLRFQRAVRLRRRGLKVADAAYEAGYADQSHMTRAFRRHGGFTPFCMTDAELGWMPIDEIRS